MAAEKRKFVMHEVTDKAVTYLNATAPRDQTCAFCGTDYDAGKGTPRPHAVCDYCWPEIHAIEEKARAEARNIQ